jgi:hypothetical protein
VLASSNICLSSFNHIEKLDVKTSFTPFDVDFINYVNKLDIVGFVETLVSDSPGNLLEYSLPFTVRPSKTRGRSSGGIAVHCKPHIQKGVKANPTISSLFT